MELTETGGQAVLKPWLFNVASVCFAAFCRPRSIPVERDIPDLL
jgi:hypothetical protein